MRIFYLYLLIILFVTSCSPSTDDKNNQDWTIYRGNSALSGYTDNDIPNKPLLKWTFKSDSRTSCSPLVYNDTVYWSDKRGSVHGVDNKGKECFKYNFATAVEATPVIYNSILYIGRIDGKMSALSLSNKDTIWNYETMGQISASPNFVYFEGRKSLVFGSYDNFLYCLDMHNGELINRFESGYYINGAVAQHKNYAVFGGCDSWLRVVDCNLGVQTDSVELAAYIPASPAIIDNFCYVADYSGNVYEFELQNGKIINQRKMLNTKNDKGSFVSVPAVAEKTVYILSDDRYLYAVDRKDISTEWKFLLSGDTGESSPVVCNNKVLVCSKSGVVSILNAKNGELIWEYDTGEQITASPAVVKDNFYILTAKGTLFCFGK